MARKRNNENTSPFVESISLNKNKILRSLYIAVLIIGFPAIILNFLVTKISGSFPIVSSISYVLLLLLLIFESKVPYFIRISFFLLIGYAIGVRGLLAEGIFSDGFLFFLILCVIASMLVGTKAGITTIALTALTTGLIALGYFLEWFNYDFDVLTYAKSPMVWLELIVVTIMFSTIILIIFDNINKNHLKILSEESKRYDELNTVNKQLKKEMLQRKRAESNLIESEKRFKQVFRSMQDSIILLNKEDKIIDVNPAFHVLTGSSKQHIIYSKLEDFFHKKDLNKIKKLPTDDHFQLNRNEAYIITADTQTPVPVEFDIHPYLEDGSKIMAIRDIREKKVMERKVLNAIIQAEENERSRVARDLHDSLGPLLSAIKLYLGSIKHEKDNMKIIMINDKVDELVRESISTVKEISNNLIPQFIKSRSIEDSLRIFIDAIKINSSIKIDLQFENYKTLPDDILVTIYRVLTELITNAIKHAKAEFVNIYYKHMNKTITIIYKDNGIGFNVEVEMNRRVGMGLFNIHSRIRALGGNVEFSSSPNEGTMVTIII